MKRMFSDVELDYAILTIEEILDETILDRCIFDPKTEDLSGYEEVKLRLFSEMLDRVKAGVPAMETTKE